MDRQTWMYDILRTSVEYVRGVNEFITCAVEHQKKKLLEDGKKDMISCPCRRCCNLKDYPNSETVREHLFRHGFRNGYTKWIWHGKGVDSGKTYGRNYEVGENSMAENDADDVDIDRVDDDDDVDVDRVEEMIQDVEDHFMHQPDIVDSLVTDSKKPLYPRCNDEFTRLSTTLKLCKLKVKNGWSDKSFTELLKFIGDILPQNNELRTSSYEAKKILCPMGMDVKKIHACPNDCVLFRNEHEHLDKCPKCGTSRNKREGNNSEGENKKRPPAKVMWYFPILQRFKRLYTCRLYIRRGVREDELGFTLVDFSRFGHEDDPFILATQVKQVMYIQDPVDSKCSIVH